MIPQNPITLSDIQKQIAKNIKESSYTLGTWVVIDDGN